MDQKGLGTDLVSTELNETINFENKAHSREESNPTMEATQAEELSSGNLENPLTKPPQDKEDLATTSTGTSAKFREDTCRAYYESTTDSLDLFKKPTPPTLVTPGPNPHAVSEDLLQNATAAFTNMYIAHEISINPDFRLVPDPRSKDGPEGTVHKLLHQAFWDVFDEYLGSNPPDYTQAINVFKEIRETLMTLMFPHNIVMKQRVEETLDVDFIQQQVEHNALDFQMYVNFIIDCLGQLCCPTRDRDIAEIRHLNKPSEIFKAILDVMAKMQLDMSNYWILMFRSDIIQNCIEYERFKFADFLEFEYRLQKDGLQGTRTWLLRHRLPERSTETCISKAFGEIIHWNYEEAWPETLVLDYNRIRAMADELNRMVIIGSIILSVSAFSNSLFMESSQDPQLVRDVLKKQLKLIITTEDIKTERLVAETVERGAEQVVKVTDEFLMMCKNRNLSDSERQSICELVRAILRTENGVRMLMLRRLLEFVEDHVCTKFDNFISYPLALGVIGDELKILLANFHKVVSHNRAVFDVVYTDIIDGVSQTPNIEKYPNDWDPNFACTMQRLGCNHNSKIDKRTQDERTTVPFTEPILPEAESYEGEDITRKYTNTPSVMTTETESPPDSEKISNIFTLSDHGSVISSHAVSYGGGTSEKSESMFSESSEYTNVPTINGFGSELSRGINEISVNSISSGECIESIKVALQSLSDNDKAVGDNGSNPEEDDNEEDNVESKDYDVEVLQQYSESNIDLLALADYEGEEEERNIVRTKEESVDLMIVAEENVMQQCETRISTDLRRDNRKLHRVFLSGDQDMIRQENEDITGQPEVDFSGMNGEEAIPTRLKTSEEYLEETRQQENSSEEFLQEIPDKYNSVKQIREEDNSVQQVLQDSSVQTISEEEESLNKMVEIDSSFKNIYKDCEFKMISEEDTFLKKMEQNSFLTILENSPFKTISEDEKTLKKIPEKCNSLNNIPSEDS